MEKKGMNQLALHGLVLFHKVKRLSRKCLEFLGTRYLPFGYVLYNGQFYKRLSNGFYPGNVPSDIINVTINSPESIDSVTQVSKDVTDLVSWYPEFGQRHFPGTDWFNVIGNFHTVEILRKAGRGQFESIVFHYAEKI
jgi:hypothetical protein